MLPIGGSSGAIRILKADERRGQMAACIGNPIGIGKRDDSVPNNASSGQQ